MPMTMPTMSGVLERTEPDVLEEEVRGGLGAPGEGIISSLELQTGIRYISRTGHSQTYGVEVSLLSAPFTPVGCGVDWLVSELLKNERGNAED
jgi:hypothetical protein